MFLCAFKMLTCFITSHKEQLLFIKLIRTVGDPFFFCAICFIKGISMSHTKWIYTGFSNNTSSLFFFSFFFKTYTNFCSAFFFLARFCCCRCWLWIVDIRCDRSRAHIRYTQNSPLRESERAKCKVEVKIKFMYVNRSRIERQTKRKTTNQIHNTLHTLPNWYNVMRERT